MFARCTARVHSRIAHDVHVALAASMLLTPARRAILGTGRGWTSLARRARNSEQSGSQFRARIPARRESEVQRLAATRKVNRAGLNRRVPPDDGMLARSTAKACHPITRRRLVRGVARRRSNDEPADGPGAPGCSSSSALILSARRRSGRGSSPCSTPPRSRSQTSSARPCCRRPRRRREAVSVRRKPGRRASRST